MKMADYQGGYDCQFVVKPPEELQTECSICLHVVREPYLVDCCGYRFCRVCIENVKAEAGKLNTSPRCPLCNENFATAVPDRLLERTLKEKQVYCQHQHLGCKWENKLGRLDVHLNVDSTAGNRLEGCQFVQIKCSYCNELIERYRLELHEESCPQRPITCTYCKKYTASSDKVSVHWNKCPSFPVTCPQDCGRVCKRVGIKDHISKSCPLTVIRCVYYDFGCKTEVERCNMPDHMEQTSGNHITLLATQCKQLQAKVDEVTVQNLSLRLDVFELNSRLLQSPKSDAVSVLCVSNCPPTTNEHKLRALFGQHGTMRRVQWDPEMNHAFVYYTNEQSVQKALAKDASSGINLLKTRLHVCKIEPNVD